MPATVSRKSHVENAATLLQTKIERCAMKLFEDAAYKL
jgi:hypothetical protein